MKALPLNDLVLQWEKDAVIDMMEPGKELIRTPVIHSKYVTQHAAHSLAAKQCSIELSRMKKIKWEYYQGRLDENELKKYGWEPFRFVLKSDVSTYIDSDEDLAKILAKKALHEQSVEFCSLVIKEINNRTWQLRTYIDYEKFIHGQ